MLRQLREVAPDGGGGNPQRLGEIRDCSSGVGSDQIQDHAKAVGPVPRMRLQSPGFGLSTRTHGTRSANGKHNWAMCSLSLSPPCSIQHTSKRLAVILRVIALLRRLARIHQAT